MLHSGLVTDIRLATRRLLAARAFSALAIITLAVGIGAVSTVFSLAYALWLKPVPYLEPDRLVWILALHEPSGTTRSLTSTELDTYQRASRAFAGLAGFTYDAGIANVNNKPLRIVAHRVTPNLFQVLGVPPAIGRDFTATDAIDGARVVMLSHRTWIRRFGQDPNVMSQTLTLDNTPHVIAGVMPRGFAFPRGALEADVWIPADVARYRADAGRTVEAVARLQADRPVEEAAAEARVHARRLAAEFPATNSEWTAHLRSAAETASESSRLAFQVLLGIVSLFLLIACTNLAGLLLARNASRRGEIAVCLSLGATRWRLTRGLLVESLVLAGVGCAVGVLLSSFAAKALATLMPSRMPGLDDVMLNVPVVGVAVAVSLLAAVFIGVFPSFSLGAMRPSESLVGTRTVARGQMRSQRVLVVSEIVLAVVLLVGAAAMARSFAGVLDRDRGYNPVGLHALNVSLPFSDDSLEDTGRRARAFEAILSRVFAVPGVTHAAATTGFPGSRLGVLGSAALAPVAGGRPIIAAIHAASPRYFDTMGTRLTAGRLFADMDTTLAPRVAIVSEFLAKQFPGENPIGKRVSLSIYGREVVHEVVGVTADITLTERASNRVYVPLSQESPYWVDLVFRAGTSTAMRDVRASLRDLNGDLLLENESSFQAIISDSLALERTQSAFALTIGVLSTIVAGIGLYALMTFLAVQRRREFGIRLALGSQPGQLFRGVLSHALRLVGLGLAIGVLASMGLVRLAGSRVFGLSSADANAYAVAAAIVCAVSVAAVWIPCRRVMKVNPLIALRAD
jgi:putative ABC transport system permease protein